MKDMGSEQLPTNIKKNPWDKLMSDPPIEIPGQSECNKLEDDYHKQLHYSIALQRAIEYHCDNKIIPEIIVKQCPYHAEILNKKLQSKCEA